MISLFLSIIINIYNVSIGIENSSWVSEYNGIYEVRIYYDRYFAVSKYNVENNTFISTSGGVYSIDNGYYERELRKIGINI